MIEQAETGVSYGVEVKLSEYENSRWEIRYGWFPESSRESGGESGLERARRNFDYVKNSGEYVDARIVRRIVKVEVIE